MGNKRLEMEEVLQELGTVREKVMIVLNDLNNDYFGEANPKGCMLTYYYEMARIKLGIALDYLIRMESAINDLKKVVEIESKK